jgi:hypothetical protein
MKYSEFKKWLKRQGADSQLIAQVAVITESH